MSDPLLIVNRKLAVVQRRLITRAGGAPCCCGGGLRCLPPVPGTGACPPPCVARVSPGAPEVFRSRFSGGVVTVDYSHEASCCAGPPWCGGTIRARQDNLSMLPGGVPCGPSYVEFRAAWNPDGTGTWRFDRRVFSVINGQCLGPDEVHDSGPISPPLRPEDVCYFGHGTNGFPYGVNVIPALFYRINGFERRDCDLYEWQDEWSNGGGEWYRGSARWAVGSAGNCRPPGTGACCCDGKCYSLLTNAQCLGMGGRYLGNGTDCREANCEEPGGPATGSCCRPNGTCFDTDPLTCAAQGGTFRPDIPCLGNPCPPPEVWSCCLPNQSGCIMTTEVDCLAQFGTWRRNVDCNQPCPADPIGACCYGNGQCQENTAIQCAGIGGNWLGANTVCAGQNCGVGACCSQAAHGGQWQCTPETAEFCATLNNSTFYGPGTVCNTPNTPCPPGGSIRIATGGETMRFGCAGCGGTGTGGATI